ncbi:hypothetical protein [Amycolatopsis sp. NPDC051061]|uniref:hypothetical protein n=1 Tax=Amycolatopsis sp. NPDC051061 TaxID=3155042 RepID=UPI0034381888
MRPLIERYWTMGEDLGLRQDVIDDVIAEIGLLSSVQAVYPLLEDRAAATERLADAFRIEVGGLGLDELVGGLADFVANSATNSWWWWTLFGDVGPDADEAYGKVRTRMRDLVTAMF